VLGLPDGVRACLFDLDGVLTDTARVHALSWKETFDAYLRARSARTGEPFVPYDLEGDFATYAAGRLRADGCRDFLASRAIELPQGDAEDPPGAETVTGLANRKNEILLRLIREQGVLPYPGSVRYLSEAKEAGLRRIVVTSSHNCDEVLAAAGLEGLVEGRIDGNLAERVGLPGKPAPDTYLAGAELAGVTPAEAAVFEDAVAGVASGRAGRFAYVVGVDRAGQADVLLAHGADVVVGDLHELLDGA
jgi:HAD superfamily hydrolase (TIGR01509 family)